MKKRCILSYLLIGAMLFSGAVFPASAAGTIDPYTRFLAKNITGVIGSANTSSTELTQISGTVYYENVDFGSSTPTYVEVGVGTPEEYAGNIFEFKIDDPNGPTIASVTSLAGDWGVPVISTGRIEIPVTGVHTLYMTGGTKPNNVFTIQFFKPLEDKYSYTVYDNTDYFTDIADNKYRRAINILRELDIIQDNALYYPDMYTTRGAFADMLYRLIGGNLEQSKINSWYPDVPGNHPYAAAISYLSDRDILSGKADGQYYPDEFITVSDANVATCRALGYSAIMEVYGSGADGYNRMASQSGFFEGLSVSQGMRRSEAAKYIYNVMNSKHLLFGYAEFGKYEEDGTVINNTLGYYRDYGIITANRDTTLSEPGGDLSGEQIRIDDELYQVGDTMAQSLLGYECEFYYSEENGIRELEAVIPKGNVEVLRISGQDYDIDKITPNQISYSDDAKIRRLNLDSSTIFLYNGVVADDVLESMIDVYPLRGSVTYIQNPSGQDVVFIEEYVNIRIDGISLEDEYFTDAISGTGYSFAEGECTIYCIKNGEPVEPGRIAMDDVAVLFASKNKTGEQILRLYLTNTAQSGMVEAVREDEVTIGGKTYPIALEMDKEKLYIGTQIDAYTNIYNEIVYCKAKPGGKYTAIFLGHYLDEDDGSVVIKLYTTDNVRQSLTLSDNARIDGEKLRDPSKQQELLDGNETALQMTPIRYKLNGDNEISVLDTVISGDKGGVDDSLTRVNGGGEYQIELGSKVIVDKSVGLVNGIWSEDAIAFSIWGEGTNTDDYGFERLVNNTFHLRGELFCFDEDSRYVNLMIIREKQSGEEATPFMFGGISSYVGPEDEIYYRITGCDGTGTVEYSIPEQKLNSRGLHKIKSLQKGDWVDATLDERGEIISMRVLFLHNGEDSFKYLDKNGNEQTENVLISKNNYANYALNQDYRYVYGEVNDKFDNYIELKHPDGKTEYVACTTSNVAVCDLKTKSNEFTAGQDMSAIQKGDKILVFIRYRGTRQIVILKNAEI